MRWAGTGMMLWLNCHPSAMTFQEQSTDTLTKTETHFHAPPSSFHLSLGNLQVRATMRKGKKN